MPSVSTWVTNDLQATWSTPWNGKVTVGVRNFADKDPLQTMGRPFDCNLYGSYGRVPYVRYTQNV